MQGFGYGESGELPTRRQLRRWLLGVGKPWWLVGGGVDVEEVQSNG